MRQPEASADETAVAEQPAHLLGQRVRGNVEILRFQAEQQISHAAADQECLEAALAQAIEHSQGVGRDVRTGHGVIRPRNNPRLYGRRRRVNR